MLHGEIKVNHITIGEWSAVREKEVAKKTYYYACDVKYRHLDGYPMSAKFGVTHYYPAGAVALTALVLSTSMRIMHSAFGEQAGKPADFSVDS